MSGRKANLTIALEDKPGQLKKVLTDDIVTILAKYGVVIG